MNDRTANTAPTPEQEVEDLSREFVHRFWDADIAWCLDHATSDFMWIGAQEEQFVFSREAFKEAVDAIGLAQIKVVLTNESYTAVAMDDSLCVVVGRYLAFSDPSTKLIISQWQRVTHVWERLDGAWKLRHYHASNPLQIVEEGESFPRSFGGQTYDYVRAILQHGERRASLVLRDTAGISHRVSPADIVYVEAVRQRTVVHCTDRAITVYRCLGPVLEDLKDAVVRVHRSFAVNPGHVDHLSRNVIVLDNGTQIAVPARRLAEVKEALAQP